MPKTEANCPPKLNFFWFQCTPNSFGGIQWPTFVFFVGQNMPKIEEKKLLEKKFVFQMIFAGVQWPKFTFFGDCMLLQVAGGNRRGFWIAECVPGHVPSMGSPRHGISWTGGWYQLNWGWLRVGGDEVTPECVKLSLITSYPLSDGMFQKCQKLKKNWDKKNQKNCFVPNGSLRGVGAGGKRRYLEVGIQWRRHADIYACGHVTCCRLQLAGKCRWCAVGTGHVRGS